MGASSTKGARSPRVLSAQTKVVVRQWPAGAKPRQRWPRGERPRAGAMLVVAHASIKEDQPPGGQARLSGGPVLTGLRDVGPCLLGSMQGHFF